MLYNGVVAEDPCNIKATEENQIKKLTKGSPEGHLAWQMLGFAISQGFAFPFRCFYGEN